MEQRPNDDRRDEEVPFRWRSVGALAGELALRAAARQSRRADDRPLPLAWAAE